MLTTVASKPFRQAAGPRPDSGPPKKTDRQPETAPDWSAGAATSGRGPRAQARSQFRAFHRARTGPGRAVLFFLGAPGGRPVAAVARLFCVEHLPNSLSRSGRPGHDTQVRESKARRNGINQKEAGCVPNRPPPEARVAIFSRARRIRPGEVFAARGRSWIELVEPRRRKFRMDRRDHRAAPQSLAGRGRPRSVHAFCCRQIATFESSAPGTRKKALGEFHQGPALTHGRKVK